VLEGTLFVLSGLSLDGGEVLPNTEYWINVAVDATGHGSVMNKVRLDVTSLLNRVNYVVNRLAVVDMRTRPYKILRVLATDSSPCTLEFK
jgi:hypothetical protein